MNIPLTNHGRAHRAGAAIAVYSDDDMRSNLVDLLADAMHWCHAKGECFSDIIGTALMHYEAELVDAAETRRNP